ncbi:anaerobic dimethyl sulfoxide reductase chain C [Peptococcaceae bacterium CEB3]|nr:anaerobic dimethyl sulfoxide reductase chain C [Peptococcaceae bacterium CEB3]
MGTLEWPLVVFTVVGEAAIGIVLALWWLDRPKADSALDSALYKKATLVSGGLLVLALVASLFHLGRPEYAYRTLSHLDSSWLSREILFFLLASAAWLYLFVQARQSQGKRRLAAGLTGILGLLGILSSSMIYVLPRVPAWDSVQTPLFFLLTAGLLGGLVLLVLGQKALNAAQSKKLLQALAVIVLTSFLSFLVYLSMLNAAGPEGMSTVQLLLNSPLFWLRVVTNWLIPMLLLLPLAWRKKALNPTWILTALIAGGLGEFLGRALFYLTAVGIQITAMK